MPPSCRLRPTALAEGVKPFKRRLNDEPEPTPPLIKAALTHVHFETIHPFLDGTGVSGGSSAALLRT